ncbi:other/AgaK1 protein kinase [Ephemerocybe angulata]|uniref:Other/AgaK1 protein kinase n=1 Tax=Ephemerocybe angulata TaxID=980116 RepID=A0A8H6IF62_9AGAR|nr:other/AgaK1 protein kinase [Tulosesus angulatus]
MDIEINPFSSHDTLPKRRFQFWDDDRTVKWFQARGYILYTRPSNTKHGSEASVTESNPYLTVPSVPEDEPFVPAVYPYACHDDSTSDPSEIARGIEERKGSVCFAQDREGRHVTIKLVPADARTDERKIYQFLHRQDIQVLEENCVLPVLEMLHFNEHCFVVMPRWGNLVRYPEPVRLREVIEFIRGCLKGLAFLHRHGIIHRDLSWGNYLVNHFTSQNAQRDSYERRGLRMRGELLYAIFDYSLSILLPPDVDPKTFRLPYNMTWEGTCFSIPDVWHGELDYDPFAYDVAVLGHMMSLDYQHLCPDLCLLAPLIDGMTTKTIQKRFTADRALAFLEANMDTVTDDKWDGLPADLVQKWAQYREPPLPKVTKLMRWLCENNQVATFVRVLRRVGRLFKLKL